MSAASLVDLMSKLGIAQYAIGSEHWVHVTHITDPSNFYVRPIAYKNYLRSLTVYEGPADPSKLQLGTSVVFQSKTKNRHVRGSIRNIRNNNNTILYDLFALDYGFFEQSVPLVNIKKPHNSTALETILHCQLADCQPKKNNVFDESAIEAMVFYVGKERAKMIVQGRTADKYIVQIFNTCPNDIATMMALTGDSCLGYGNNVISRMPSLDQPKLYYIYKQVKAGDTLKVRVQSGDSLTNFFVSEIEDYKKYNQEFKDFKDFYHREQDFLPENLKCGCPVAVFSDRHSRYERAVIKEIIIAKEEAVVQFVDWGTELNIYIGGSRLKALSREFYFLRPAMAIYCTAEKSQAWDNGLHRFLYPGFEFFITIKKVGHQHETPNTVSISKAIVK